MLQTINGYIQVLKVAVLAEKYATDYKWYVDVILNLIRLAGDYVSEEVTNIIIYILSLLEFILKVLSSYARSSQACSYIFLVILLNLCHFIVFYKLYVYFQVWYRVIQIVINRDDVQGYAAKTVFEVK